METTETTQQLWQKRIFRVAGFAIFLALIRSIAEPFRLDYLHPGEVAFDEIKPFLLGALVCALTLLMMTLLSYYRRYLAGTVVAVLCILVLLAIKFMFLHQFPS